LVRPPSVPTRESHARYAAAVGLLGLLFVLAAGPGAAPATAQALRLEPVLANLSSPLYVTHARDGSRRLFVVEQGGRIKVLAPGTSAPTVFLDITARVLSGGERGLLGLAFHPGYRINGRFFVNYTRRPDGDTVIAEYRVSVDPNVADPTETVLLTVVQPFANHNGGMVEFGPDGFLYLALGDGGSGNDPGNRAQNLAEVLGKILRIDVDRPAGGLPYSAPPNNPFVGVAGARPEVFALGLRNPFRFAFDRQTGQLLAGDVGQGAVEEVDDIIRGGNYGWRVFEGTRCTGTDPTLCDPARFLPPLVEYAHTGGRCSITGGYVYRGPRGVLPPGTYVFGDFCTGEIFQFAGGTMSILLATTLSISSFGEDEDGELHVVGLGGTVDRLAPAATRRLTVSPPSGIYLLTQGFDLVLILEGAGPGLAGGRATLDGVDVSAALAGCLVSGTLPPAGVTLRCPGLQGALLGPGVHTLSVTLDFVDGTNVTATVTWDIRANIEP
jgi:glucose/arabinose dehydrogenase